jgi:DNA-binding SARP family transcriptional activator/WD40 repeat protein
MEFRVLGAVEALEDGLRISLGGPKQRSLLAMLLLEPNRAVSTDRLVDGLWGDDPPHRPAATLQVYVSNLRKILEPDRSPRAEPSVLVTQPPGYLLVVDPEQIDLFRFERLVALARSLWLEHRVPGAAVVFRAALSCWRESPFADLASEPWARFEVPRLEEARTGALEDLVEAELALGRDVELLPELEALVARNPFRERFRRQLMLALYRAGRQADALAAYQDARETLVDELGLEPSRELREMEAAILVHEPELAPAVLPPIDADDVVYVLAAIDGAAPDDVTVAAIVEEGRHSARRAEDALRRAVTDTRADRLSTRLEAAAATHVELVRVRQVIADDVLDRRAPDPLEPRAAVGSCPYRGLLHFEPEDAAWYFGRERAVAELLASVASARCTGIVGASGSGKSSLARAGLVAALAEDALPGSARWPCVLVTPGADPVFELARALAPVAHATSADAVHDSLLDDPASLAAFAERVTERANGADDAASMMIVVDQLEEVFTVCRDESMQARFFDLLVQAACDPDSPTRVLVAIRSDYYGRCAEHAAFAELLGQANLLVAPMRRDELARAIEAPAARAGLTLEAGLSDRILDDVGAEPGALPLLETALLGTWNRRSGSTLTVEGYTASGGVHGAVAHLADDVYSRLSFSDREIARAVFLRLAEPGEGSDDVRRRAPLDELIVDDAHAAVLATLVDRRLVVTDDATAEVAHEALLREWPRLRGWLEEDREGRRIQRALSNAAEDWTSAERDDDLLFRGSRLAAALDVADAHPTEINPLEREFLATSSAHQDSELRSARRTADRLRRGTVALAGLLVVALVAVAFSVVQRSRADESASRAEAQAEVSDATALATQTRSLTDEHLDLALLLGVEAFRLNPSVETEGALATALAAAPAGVERVMSLDPPAPYPNISPDTKLLAAVGQDGVVRLIDTNTGRLVRRLDGPRIEGAFGPFFNRHGRRLAVGSAQGNITVWDVASGRRLGRVVAGGNGPAIGIFDPTDGTRLFTVGHDGTVVRWDLHEPSRLRRTDLFTVAAATYPGNLIFDVSNDGRRLLVGDPTTGPTSVWDLASGGMLSVVPGVPGLFGADGRTLTTSTPSSEFSGGLGSVTVWDAASGRPVGAPITGLASPGWLTARSPDDRLVVVTELFTPGLRVLDVATGQDVIPPITGFSNPFGRFLPDGRLFIASDERVAILRPSSRAVAPLGTVLGGTRGTTARATFTRDGRGVVTLNGVDGARLWNAASGALVRELPGPDHASSSVFPSPDLRKAVVLAHDGTLRISDAERDGRGAVLASEPDPVTSLTWSSDGSTLALGFAESTLLWRVDDPAHPRLIARLRAAGEPDVGPYLSSVAFSPDDRRVVVVREYSGKATMFDTTNGRRLRVFGLPSPGQTLSAVAFSPDGHTLAATVSSGLKGGAAWRVVFFDVATGAVRARMPLPAILYTGVAYARDGHRLVTLHVAKGSTATTDGAGTVELYDTATLRAIGEPLAVPAAPRTPGGIFVQTSADGRRVVHGGDAGFAVVWDLDPAHWTTLACRVAGRTLTRAEWRRYLPGRDYDPACGA